MMYGQKLAEAMGMSPRFGGVFDQGGASNISMIAIAERPEAERAAFRAFFDHYVFRPDGHPLAHVPEDRRGVLRDIKGAGYGPIRAMVLRALRGG